MGGLRQIVAGYLALCLMLGGAVGISPMLHRLIEHRGSGLEHTHVHQQVVEGQEFHGHLHPVASARAGGFFRETHHKFTISGEAWSRIWQALLGHGDSDEPSSRPDGPGHTHHSLAQLMVNGLVEATVSAVVVETVTPLYPLPQPKAELFFAAVGWNAQAATRGPPISFGPALPIA